MMYVCMLCTIRVYAYGTTVHVWYGYLYHMHMATITVYKQYIPIASTVLFTLNHELYPWCSFPLLYCDVFTMTRSDKLVISGWTMKVTLN